jgi:hypothetical protein
MDIHPQFFDRQKTLLLEPLAGHTGLSSQGPGQMPRAFAADGHEDGRLLYHAPYGHVWQISPDKDVNPAVAGLHQPRHLPYFLNPGLRHVVLTCPETGPCMPFLFPGSAGATLAHSFVRRFIPPLWRGFIRTLPHGSVPRRAGI